MSALGLENMRALLIEMSRSLILIGSFNLSRVVACRCREDSEGKELGWRCWAPIFGGEAGWIEA